MKLRGLLLLLLISALALAKDAPQVINWPDDQKPLLKVTVLKIRKLGDVNGVNAYSSDFQIQNLSGKKIDDAEFNFYFFDKNKVRIGQGWLQLNNVGPDETIKTQVDAQAAGTPVTMSLTAVKLPTSWQGVAPAKKTTLTIYSVPAGAQLSLDGKPAGVTPVAVEVATGPHKLEFTKAGFNTGTFPLVITPDQLSGGSVTYELGTSAHDTVELRDGTTITGDVDSIVGMDVTIRVGGTPQHYDRNQIKRILFTEREPAPKQ